MGKLVLVFASVLLISAGCGGSEGTKVQSTTSGSETGERPPMQTDSNGVQVDRGVKMDLGSEGRRSPPK